MKLKFILNTSEPILTTGESEALFDQKYVRTAQEIWKGELELPDGVLVMKVSVIAEGQPHPICDIPFSLTEGHWRWIPPAVDYEEDVERIGGNAFDDKGKRIQT